MAVVETETLDIPTRGVQIRALVARPKGVPGRLPAVIAWSDIFQLTPPHVRMVTRLAGHGFWVVAPEIYSRLERPGTVHDFERDRQRALDDAALMQPEWIDEERRDLLDWMKTRRDVDPARIGAAGWCFGGHLAFRAALEPDVKATSCFYATGVHDGNLGAAKKGRAGTLERVSAIRGTMLLVWGLSDPHIPASGRDAIHSALAAAGVRFEVRAYEAEHAFMRDEGPRYDPESTDRAFAEMIDHFRRTLAPRAPD